MLTCLPLGYLIYSPNVQSPNLENLVVLKVYPVKGYFIEIKRIGPQGASFQGCAERSKLGFQHMLIRFEPFFALLFDFLLGCSRKKLSCGER
jgi:hypothetical protein